MKIISKPIAERVFTKSDGTTGTRYARRTKPVKYIIVHYLGDAHANSRALPTAKAMQTSKRSVSTHYIVGVDGVYNLLNPEKYVAYHCPYSPDNASPACNSNAIGVDLAEFKTFTNSNSVQDADWQFCEKVLDDGAHLIAELCKRFDIPICNVVRHFDVTGKLCPRPFTYGGKHDLEWIKFKDEIRGLL